MPPKPSRIAPRGHIALKSVLGAVLCLLWLPVHSWTFTPCAKPSSASVSSCLLEITQEIERQSVKEGGTVSNNLALSSSTNVTGNAQFDSSVTLRGGLFGATDNSAFATYTASQTTASTTWVAVVGTTVTITTRGALVCAEFRCALSDETSGGNSCIGGILFNGAYQDGMSDTLGYTVAHDPADSIGQSASPWAHCVATRYASGTAVSAVAVLRSQNATETCAANSGLRVACQMHVYELR